MNKRRGTLRRMWDNLAARTVAYYVVLVTSVTLLWWRGPENVRPLLVAPSAGVSFLDELTRPGAVPPVPADAGPFDQTFRTGIAMTVAALLALPIAWVYILTRRKKGFRQSMVHTLLMLPVVVSGVMVLVKTSLALAFALAGVVAAVRFRNTLEESKDAVYIFLATALGLAAGVDPPVALAISLIYNTIILALWYTDFGRTSAVFEGAVAEHRLEQARQFAGRQSSFITKLDDAILKDLSPEQLDVLTDRASKRRRQATDEYAATEEESGYDVLLRVRTLNDQTARAAVEPVLNERLKKWRFSGMSREGDVVVLEYAIRLRKKMTPNTLRDAVQAAQCPDIMGIEAH